MEYINGIFVLINLGVSFYVLRYSIEAFRSSSKKNKSVALLILGIGVFFNSYAVTSGLLYFLSIFSVLDTTLLISYIRFMSNLTMIVLGIGFIGIFKEQV